MELKDILNIIISVIISFSSFIIKSHRDSSKQKKVLASAFFAEIDSLQKQWEWGTQGGLKKVENNEPVPLIFNRVRENYFTVYDKNADKIGMFDQELVKDLVYLYNDAKGFLDTVGTWEEMIKNPDKDKVVNLEIILRNYYNIMVKQQNNVFDKANKVKDQLKSIIGSN
ncbi:hypothetical protein Ga0466249_004764 [Sporomusaceae bacterium BoRhaA]|uniref:hypothetical protein n=1 Tax=Pelorhabdus rhamnosifermentans TaxID=2772457 RepID=UPI001C064324|nr:hypothetical protein [Pelorhabdus rhamnosifermentans]MBU2703619.1 hypothetical protein [Pelorhabdus rhamnosifermentans]